MFSEESIVNTFLYNVVCKIHCAGISAEISPVRVLTASLVSVGLVTYTHIELFTYEASIVGLVLVLTHLSFSALTISFLRFHTKIFHNGDANIVYKQISQIDARMKLTVSKQKDLLLLSMPVIIILLAGFLLNIIYNRGNKLLYLSYLAVITACYELVSLAMMKLLIVKRLRYIRTAEEFMERVEDTVFITRQLLECNRKLNKTNRQLATIFAIYAFQVILYYLYSLWLRYEAGVRRQVSVVNFPVSSAGFFSALISVLLLLALTTSLIADEIEDITLELDISKTARSCTERERKMISLFLLELHHTPTQLSALGLFDIHLPGLSTACAIMLSYLLVLIQFSELFTG